MLRVVVYLDSAITGKTTELGSLCIANDGTGSADIGNYNARLLTKTRRPTGKTGRVEGHRRKALSVWKLVAKALASVGHEYTKPSNR